MENTKNVKALKKQLMAAIAMVCVAAVALGSSTYAWFVSNNKVEATTTNISAQSNSAYLVIDKASAGKTSTTSTSSATASETFTDTKLYPAQWANNFAENKGTDGTKVYQFESAYASSKDAATENENTRFAVGNPETAATADYTLANTFYIGTGTYDGIFKDLKVTSVSVNNTENSGLESAMRVLVTCGDAWVVWSKDGLQASSDAKTNEVKGDGILKADEFGQGIVGTTKDATVKVYVYYDGADEKVYTTNLDKLKECGVTVTFEATPTEYGK